jgi:hypothetical protein
MRKMTMNTTHQSWLRCSRAAQIVRLKKIELMIEISTRMIVDYMVEANWIRLADGSDDWYALLRRWKC